MRPPETETKTKSGILFPTTAKHSLKSLKPVLKTWIELVERYSSVASKHETPSTCYWASERSSVGVLASAAWNTEAKKRTEGKKWIALEESPTRKKGRGLGEKHGRCDLWVATSRKSFAFEAKQISPLVKAGDEQTAAKSANEQLTNKQPNSAWNDVGSVANDEADVRIAACFFVPRFNKGLEGNPLEPCLNVLVEYLKKNTPADAIAWVFPETNRGIFLSTQKHLFPGVCLLLRVRDRGH